MKRIIIFLVLFLYLLCGLSQAETTLYRIRFGLYPEKLRAVFDFDGSFTYYADEAKDQIVIHLKNIKASPDISNYVELNDLIVRYFKIERLDKDLNITIPLAAPINYSVFYLNDPPRLVIDFDREFLNIVSGGNIADGVEFLRVTKGTSDGNINACVLRIDLDKAEVEPALPRPAKATFIDSVMDFLIPWTERVPSGNHLRLKTVSDILEENNALAGVNGTYFAYTGKPLGALMIDRELLSFPIYGRTAFFLDSNNQPYIDNIFVSSSFTLESGTRYVITGVNEGRGVHDIVMYTPAWGPRTGTSNHGIEFVVSNSKVEKIVLSDAKIPDEGYVLSVRGPMVESLMENIKVGDKLNAQISIIPYATSPKNVVHLISGGPRLLKKGRVYVSKHGEKFQVDIAEGRAARTAVGIDSQGQLLLVTVDGPVRRNGRKHKQNEPDSIGVTLEELSRLMLSLGAVEAMNLDGGSSSTMVIENRLVNQPTGGSQRRVSNVLLVRPKFRVPQPQIR